MYRCRLKKNNPTVNHERAKIRVNIYCQYYIIIMANELMIKKYLYEFLYLNLYIVKNFV